MVTAAPPTRGAKIVNPQLPAWWVSIYRYTRYGTLRGGSEEAFNALGLRVIRHEGNRLLVQPTTVGWTKRDAPEQGREYFCNPDGRIVAWQQTIEYEALRSQHVVILYPNDEEITILEETA